MSQPVIHVIDDLVTGGAQSVVVAFAREAAKQQIPVVVVSIEPRRDDALVAQLLATGAELLTLTESPGPTGRLSQLRELVGLFRARRPRVVQTHLTYANLLGVPAARLAGVPVTATLHSARTGDDGNSGGALRAEGRALRLATHIVAVGERVAGVARERLGDRPVHVIPNAVSPPPVQQPGHREAIRDSLGITDQEVLVLAVGRLVPAKGYLDLLSAFDRASRTDPRLRLLVAGEGELKHVLLADVSARVMQDRVRLLGSRDDVADLLSAADVFVQASHWEGLPMAVLEAMAAGLPVVATGVGDLPDVVTPEVGTLVPAQDPDAFARALVGLANDPDRRARAGAAAASVVTQRFGTTSWLDRLLSLNDSHESSVSVGEQPIRVVMLIQRYWPWIGGAERQLGDVAPALVRHGIDVHIVTRRLPGFSPLAVVDGVTVHRVANPGRREVASIAYTLGALKLIRELEPDVVHAHELLSPATTAMAARRSMGIRTSTTAHRSGELGDVAVLSSGGALGRRRLALLSRWIDRFIVISSEIGDELEAIGVPRDHQSLIPNGVDTQRFQPPHGDEERAELRRRLGLPGGPLALFTGRLAPEKRVGLLIDLWPSVRARVPGAELVVAGTGEEEESLRQQASQVDGATLIGRIEDVAPYHRVADVFVLPSVAEGLSVAMLEAMASGSPPVMSAVGGTGDVLEHGRTGWLVDPHEPAQLVDGITTLLGDPVRRRVMGDAARAVVEERFSLDLAVARHAEIYRELGLQTRAARRR